MIDIQNYSEEIASDKSNQCAVFDIYLPKSHLTFRRLKLCIAKNGKYYIQFPSYVVREVDGKKEWGKLWEFGKEKQDELVKMIKVALQVYKPGISL